MNTSRSWPVIWALTLVEYRTKYAGSILGSLWYPLYSAMLLGSYCFIYLVVFSTRYRDLGTYDYVLFIFSGLVPYLGFSEAVSTSTGSVKGNLTLLRNAVFPIEFVPVKHVLASVAGTMSSLTILVVMILPTSHMGWHMLCLPLSVTLLLIASLAAAWVLSAVAVIIPDIGQVINIALLLLLFVSPVAFSIDMVPAGVKILVYANPLTYLVESFRYSLMGIRSLPLWVDMVSLVTLLFLAGTAAAFFRRMSPVFSEYEQ